MKMKEAVVLICDSVGRNEIWDKVLLTANLHSAAPHAISLPLLLQLVKLIPNFTPVRAITLSHVRILISNLGYLMGSDQNLSSQPAGSHALQYIHSFITSDLKAHRCT